MTNLLKGFSFLLCLFPVCSADDGILFIRPRLSSTEWEDHFCIDFNPYFEDLPAQQKDADVHNLTDLSERKGCNGTDYVDKDVNGTVVVVARGDCNFALKAALAQTHGAVGIIIASDELLSPGPTNATVDYKEINITVATVLWSDVKVFQKEGDKLEVMMYAPHLTRKFDPNLILIFAIAVSNIFIGGYWSGLTKHKKYVHLVAKKKQEIERKRKRKADGDDAGDDDADKEDEEDDESVDISLPVILVFFILVCGFLISLYFFYEYLVYVVIAMFCLAGAMGMYYCILPLWRKIIPLNTRLPVNKVPCFKSRPELRALLLMLLCAGLAVFWGVQRHKSYAWILQDILGFAFCINVMKTIHIPNLKICTVMLLLLFVYDIFFVFITPLFTKSGDSIMVKVATGGDSNEQLPMVFQVPRLSRDILSVCPTQNSLLGFGDIIIPGLLVAHNHAFDLKVKGKKVYYIATGIAYAIGLIITFVALALMNTGQPALLYLVPCTLGTTFLIGLKRREVKKLWSGVHQVKIDDSKEEENADTTETSNGETTTTDIAGNVTAVSINSINSDSSTGSDNEHKELLRKK